jgi:hypothetical protein
MPRIPRGGLRDDGMTGKIFLAAATNFAGHVISTRRLHSLRPARWRKKLNRALRLWEKIYNIVRPYQALGYLTRLQFLRQISS